MPSTLETTATVNTTVASLATMAGFFADMTTPTSWIEGDDVSEALDRMDEEGAE